MKKITIATIFLVLLVSCKQKIVPKDIANMNGYWEIERVDLPDGDHKEYKMNEVYDFFDIKNNKGYRKKVMPQLDGTFLANDASENVEIVFLKDQVFLKFKTEYATWKEELKQISATEMVVENDKKIEYKYKKTAPINLLIDGKTNK